jgi:hypothetical protein
MDIVEIDNSTETQEVGTQTETQTDTKNVEVPLNVLNSLKTILEVSIARGAYRANEIKMVGGVYEVIENLINKK